MENIVLTVSLLVVGLVLAMKSEGILSAGFFWISSALCWSIFVEQDLPGIADFSVISISIVFVIAGVTRIWSR